MPAPASSFRQATTHRTGGGEGNKTIWPGGRGSRSALSLCPVARSPFATVSTFLVVGVSLSRGSLFMPCTARKSPLCALGAALRTRARVCALADDRCLATPEEYGATNPRRGVRQRGCDDDDSGESDSRACGARGRYAKSIGAARAPLVRRRERVLSLFVGTVALRGTRAPL